jgi:hypothetical protein
MSYTFAYKNPALNNKNPFSVAVGTLDTTTTDLTFTGKGAANFGQAQQLNLLRLLENFADVAEPANATIGQLWYDSSERTIKVCMQSTPTKVWQELNGFQVTDVGEPAPGTASLPPLLGDMWFQRTGASSGFLYTYTGIGRYPSTATTIGGWEQIWPNVEVYAGRDEYDAVRSTFDQLCGGGIQAELGSGAIGRSITNLTNFTALDADLQAKYVARGIDTNILSTPADIAFLKVEPNAQDWDALLAAIKYAVNRLEVPSSFVSTVSALPFVYDGRQPPATLLGYATSDVRYPSGPRRAGRHGSAIGLTQSFAETINALNVAIDNRFSMMGINGNTGTNTMPIFSVDAGFAATAFTPPGLTFRLNFTTADEMQRWTNAGSGIRVELLHSGGASAGDVNLNALLSSGLYVITGDKVRVFDTAGNLHATQATTNLGLWHSTIGGQQIYTSTGTAASLTISAKQSQTGSFYFELTITLTPNGAITVKPTFQITLIQDHESGGVVYPVKTSTNLTPVTFVA